MPEIIPSIPPFTDVTTLHPQGILSTKPSRTTLQSTLLKECRVPNCRINLWSRGKSLRGCLTFCRTGKREGGSGLIVPRMEK